MAEPIRIPELPEARRLAVEDALNHSFKNGRLNVPGRDEMVYWAVLHPEAQYAGLMAREYVSPEGTFFKQERLRTEATAAIESISALFQPSGVVGDGDMNTAYFGMLPITSALRDLEAHVDAGWHSRMLQRCVKLFADAAQHIDRSHDYLNPRGLEAVVCLNLHRLTGEDRYLGRCQEILDQLLTRLYPCGAQPYHTGVWVWGRKPSQGYQFLTAGLMLQCARELNRPDVEAYVRRIMDYSLLATNRHGEAFVTVFEGLHKAGSRQCVGRQWVICTALGDARYRALARTTYELWAQGALGFGHQEHKKANLRVPRTGYLEALSEASRLGITEVPPAPPFVPEAAQHIFPDISSVFIHEEKLDLAMTLLTGYSAFAEADFGSIKLYALTPELMDDPTYSNAGTDPLRNDWKIPSEQMECRGENGKTILRGRVFTKWQTHVNKDFARLHNRFLEVKMTFENDELLFEFETLTNNQKEPTSNRLLFLLIARPRNEKPRLQIGGKIDVLLPPADSEEPFSVAGPVETVRFIAPDGSTLEIIPEQSLAERVTAERPPKAQATAAVSSGGTRAGNHKTTLKPANEGSLRLAFDGMNTLDKGRYRLRFIAPLLQ